MTTETDATQQNLAIINQVEAGLAALEDANKELPDFSTNEGYKRAKELRKPLVKARVSGDKARLAATAGLREQVKSINSMWFDTILPRIQALEDPLIAGIKAVDDEKARIEREAAEKEQRRIEDIEGRLGDIQKHGNAMSTATSMEQLDEWLAECDHFVPSDFDEFHEQAADAIERARAAGATRKAELLEQAARQAELDKLRAEREAQEAKLREEQERMERERQAIEDERRKLQEEREAEARRAAIADAERKAAAKAERERVEAAERAAKEKAEAVEKARLEAIAEEQRKREEAERKAAEAEAERKRIAALRPDHEKLTEWLDAMPTIPDMDTDEGVAASAAIQINLDHIGDIVNTLVPDEQEVA